MGGNKIGVISSTDLIVSHQLKRKRLLLGLSQAKVGQALGVSIQQIQKYEKGTNRISSGHLYNLAVFFEVSTDYFFKSEMTYTLNNKNSAAEKQVICLIEAFNRIKDLKVQNKIIEITRLISSC